MTQTSHGAGRFRLCPEYRVGETGQSYLGRLTGFFGCPSQKEFCDDFLLDLHGILTGVPEALRDLAAITGAEPVELLRCTPRRINKHSFELSGKLFHAQINFRHRIAICPLCAIEDIAANPSIPLDQAV